MTLGLGMAAFGLFWLYDVNSFLWQHRIPRSFFTIGSLLLAVSLVLDVLHAAFAGWEDMLFLGLGALALAALIYTLFFALPFDETYARQNSGRHVCDRGVYALCRHPGILCFFFMYLFLGLAALPASGLLVRGMILSAVNLLYAWFQDCVTFPRTFVDYQQYQQKVPFLLPTKASLKRFSATLVRSGNEEGEL